MFDRLELLIGKDNLTKRGGTYETISRWGVQTAELQCLHQLGG